jgi:hypothetical protein
VSFRRCQESFQFMTSTEAERPNSFRPGKRILCVLRFRLDSWPLDPRRFNQEPQAQNHPYGKECLNGTRIYRVENPIMAVNKTIERKKPR